MPDFIPGARDVHDAIARATGDWDGPREEWLWEDAETLAAEVKRLHSWDGLMSLLDEHWPADIFITAPDPEDYHEPLYRRDPGRGGAPGTPGQYVRANPGVIITGLIRWVDRLREPSMCSCGRPVEEHEAAP